VAGRVRSRRRARAAGKWRRAKASAEVREVAITFDDLPIVSVLPRDIETSRELTRKLLAGVAAHHVPAIGFVNEDKLNAAGGRSTRSGSIYCAAGLMAVSSSATTPTRIPIASDAARRVRSGRAERRARHAAADGRARADVRFFRHPFLHTGP
jgi:hypothetical protein